MCGIAGKISNPKKIVNTKEVSMIQKSLHHRGPDGNSIAISKRVNLAMTRLSIIDVPGGDQPLYNEDKTIEIVGNGEIYNYIELQKELKKKGHKLKTGSDIETIVHLYEEMGLDCVSKLQGMFALALYDKKKQKVILFRDRLGEKPLYYTKVSDGIVFASELKALLKAKGVNKVLDPNSIDRYFNYYYVPEPSTIFSKIKKLPAGNLLVIDLKTMNIKEKEYWNASNIVPSTKTDPTKKIRNAFARACELTLRSDVPVGISLSGGIDSGSIAALSAPKYKDKMKAFSIGYEGSPPSDERKMAKELATKFGLEFIEAELKTSDVVEHFPQLVKDADDPIADIAGHAIYSVAKLAQDNNIKVLLGGLGGDELFWGYPATVEATKDNIKKLSMQKTARSFDFRNPDPETTSKNIRGLYSEEFKQKLTHKNGVYPLPWGKLKADLEIAKHSMDLVRDLWLKSDPIALNDRLSMATSVETRSPFLDHKLVEVVLSSTKAVNGYKLEPKYWFKKAMEGVLPEKILNRPKQGFTPPVSQWLRAINDEYTNLLRNGFLIQEKILDEKKLKHVVLEPSKIPQYSLYQLILLEIWGRIYIWGKKPSEI